MPDVVLLTIEAFISDDELTGYKAGLLGRHFSEPPIRIAPLAVAAAKCWVEPFTVDRHQVSSAGVSYKLAPLYPHEVHI